MIRRIALVGLLLTISWAAAQEAGPPASPKFPVTDTYLRGTVRDPYRWLEEMDSGPTKHWVESQNQYAAGVFARSALKADLTEAIRDLYTDAPTEYRDVNLEGGTLVAKVDDVLCVLESLEDVSVKHVLLDPQAFVPNRSCSIDMYTLSPDGKVIAALVSVNGLEEGTIYFFDAETGKQLPDELHHASASPGGDMAWRNDGGAVFYTRYPNLNPPRKRDQHSYGFEEVWLHTLGQKQAEDLYVLGRECPRYAQLTLRSSKKEPHLLVSAPTGWGAEGQHLYRWTPKGGVVQVVSPRDEVGSYAYGPAGTIILESCKDAPRGKLLKISQEDDSIAKAVEILPQSDHVLFGWWTTRNYLYVVERKDGSDRIRVIDTDGKQIRMIELPPFTAVVEMTPLKGDRILYMTTSFLRPPEWYAYDPDTGKSSPHEDLSEEWPLDFDDCEVVRALAPSKDGTMVPYEVIRRKNFKPTGEVPVLLHGYGGFKQFEQPNFQAYRKLWLDSGAIWVVAHPRGEGELGQDWYTGGVREKKIKSAEDFIAVAEHLIGQRVTRPGKIGIMGGSNGGLLVGMAMTQRPDLFGAVVGNCGLYDMLRAEFEPFGPHLTCEFGTVTNGTQFLAMRNASPYHQVDEKKSYPATWLRTGGNDRRVTPWHTWKMAARLQATAGKKPILVTTYPDEGHNFIGSIYDEAAFFFEHLGIRPPKRAGGKKDAP